MHEMQHEKAAADKVSKQEQEQGPPASHTDLSDMAASAASAISGTAADVSSAASAQARHSAIGSAFSENKIRPILH